MRSTIPEFLLKAPRRVAMGCLWVYQTVLRPVQNALLCPGGCCRFYPSCSDYAMESIKLHGLFRGGLHSLVRLCKCHPFNHGGFDPVRTPASPTPSAGCARDPLPHRTCRSS